MAAVMVVMVLSMMTGPQHGYMGPYIVNAPQIEATYMEIDRPAQAEQSR